MGLYVEFHFDHALQTRIIAPVKQKNQVFVIFLLHLNSYLYYNLVFCYFFHLVASRSGGLYEKGHNSWDSFEL